MHVSRFFLLMGCAAALFAARVPAQARSGMVGKAAPEFVRRDLAENEVDLKKYHGKVVLLNFWATWCAPCQMELPLFEAWQKRYGSGGLQVIAVSMDDADAPVRRTAGKLHLGFPVVMGDAKLGETYGGVLGLPVTFLIDREGVVVKRYKGQADLATMEADLKRLLAR